jgi:hypothetical protein
MEAQTLINYSVLLCGALGGWILKVLWDSIHELKIADAALIDKVTKIEVMVAGSYVTREEFQRTIATLFSKLDRIEDKIDHKVDK